MITSIRLVFAVFLILAVTLVLAPLQWFLRLLNAKLSRKIPQYWHKMVLWLIGVRVNIHGKFSASHPLLLVCNHISWVDILILGSVRPLCFIAKSEIGSWPVISKMAKLQGTVFIDRTNSRDSVNQADTIASRLLKGDVMVLFAEGTTGDGNTILPFNSSLLGAAQYAVRQSHIEHATVQPLAICYSRLHGQALGRRFQSLAAWPGDVPLGPHLIRFLRKSAFDVDVILGQPLTFDTNSNRKTITKNAHEQVSAMFGKAIRQGLSIK